MESKIENRKTVLITGSGKRLGAAISQGLAACGHDLIMHFNKTKPDINALNLKYPDIKIAVIQSDFSADDSVKDFIKRIKEFKRLDFIINNASVFPKTSFQLSKQNDYEEIIRINALIPFMITKELCAHFPVKSVINMIDSRITGYEPDRHPYHVSKRLFFDLTKDLALAFAPQTRVNAICPGAILAPEGVSEEAFRKSADLNPLKITGNSDQIVLAMNFLLDNPFVTGQTIFVDGGRHLYENFYGT